MSYPDFTMDRFLKATAVVLAITLGNLSLPGNGWVTVYNAYIGWGGDQWVCPKIRHGHLREEDAAAFVSLYSSAQDYNLKVVGASYTESDLNLDDELDIAFDLYRNTHLLAVDASQAAETGYTFVSFEGGAKLYDINRELAALGLALEVIPGVDGISVIGGAVTGSHGSSTDSPATLASAITNFRLLTSAGHVLDVSESQDPELFHAARTGKLNIVNYLSLIIHILEMMRIDNRANAHIYNIYIYVYNFFITITIIHTCFTLNTFNSKSFRSWCDWNYHVFYFKMCSRVFSPSLSAIFLID